MTPPANPSIMSSVLLEKSLLSKTGIVPRPVAHPASKLAVRPSVTVSLKICKATPLIPM